MIQPDAEAFFEACGAQTAAPLEVAHRGRGVIVRQQMLLPFARIGRDERADLRLDSREVSHRHAYLQIMAGCWWWVDLDSRTGTHYQESRASQMHRLDHQGIHIGSYIIRLASPSPLAATQADERAQPAGERLAHDSEPIHLPDPLTTDSDDLSVLPRVALEFHGGTEGPRTWNMDRALALIGRSSVCKVRLQSPLISRVHCAVVNTPFGLWVVDLLGRDGTRVNGKIVRWGLLEPDDEMHIDQFRIRVHYLTPPRSAIAMYRSPSADQDVDLTPGANANGEAENRSLALHGTNWGQEDERTKALAPLIAPAGLGVPMTGAESLLMPLVKQFNQMQQQMFDQFQQTLLMVAQLFGNVQREQMALIRQELEQIQELTRQLHTLSSEEARPASSPLPAIPPVQTADTSSSSSSRTKAMPATAKPNPPPPPAKFAEGDVHAWLTQRLATLQEERQTRWQKVLNLITGK